jgi:recombination protein RecA
MGDQHMGLQARLMSQAMRKLAAICSKTKTTVIFINQIRMKIGLVFGNPETVAGGNALKFYASQRLEVRRAGIIKSGEGDEAVAVASQTRVKVVKNKVFPPFRECEFIIRYGTGIDIYADLLLTAIDMKVVEKAGAWYSYKGQRLGQGEENAIATLRDNISLREEIEAQL